MTLTEALTIAEEAIERWADGEESGDSKFEQAAAVLARLRAELPKLHAIVAENLTRPRLEIVARLEAILARLEEGEGT